MTALADRPARTRGAASSHPRRPSTLARVWNPGYIAHDLRRNLRMFSNLVFIVVLPVTMYLIFGAMQDYSTIELANGNGNISATIMLSMAVYGAITATTGLAGSAAVELQQGWARQLGLTPFTRAGYVVTKTVVAITIALLPVLAVFAAGALTTATMRPWVWLASGALVLVGSTVFALFGLAMGLLFRSEAAVGAASGAVVILMFLGNSFVPLTGFLLDLSPYTPVWGVATLAGWPLTEGRLSVGTDGATVQYELWMPLVSIVVWAAVFGALALWGTRRHTARK